MRVRWREQGGAAMVLLAISLMTLLLVTGLALDYGRAHLLRAQLQTALDAATLAGALQATPWVEITVRRRYWYRATDYCYDPDNGIFYPCGAHWEWRDASVPGLVGREYDLLPDGWRRRVDCAWRYECLGAQVDRAWIELKPDAYDWARDAFRRNADWPQGPAGVRVRDFWIGPDPGGRPWVAGRAVLAFPTSFLRLVGIGEVAVFRTAAAEPVRRERRRVP